MRLRKVRELAPEEAIAAQKGSQLKHFIDTAGPLWTQHKLAGKVVTAFTAASLHGGQESTLLALYNTFYHWGSIIVPNGYTHAIPLKGVGNPYGRSFTATDDGAIPEAVLDAAHHQGSRLAAVAALLADHRASLLAAS